MRNLIRNLQSYWLADASFVTLLVMLVAAVFVLPVTMEFSSHGVLLFNMILLSVFFSGIFSTHSLALISVSAILFGIHLTLRIIRFGENPYSMLATFRSTLGVLFPAIVIARLIGLASSRN